MSGTLPKRCSSFPSHLQRSFYVLSLCQAFIILPMALALYLHVCLYFHVCLNMFISTCIHIYLLLMSMHKYKYKNLCQHLKILIFYIQHFYSVSFIILLLIQIIIIHPQRILVLVKIT